MRIDSRPDRQSTRVRTSGLFCSTAMLTAAATLFSAGTAGGGPILTMTATPSPLAPFELLTVSSDAGSPCPNPSSGVSVRAVVESGPNAGDSVGGSSTAVEPDGSWSYGLDLLVVGQVSGVPQQYSAPSVRLEAACFEAGDWPPPGGTLTYEPVVVTLSPMSPDPALTASFDPTTGQLSLSGTQCTDNVTRDVYSGTPTEPPDPANLIFHNRETVRGTDNGTWSDSFSIPIADVTSSMWVHATCVPHLQGATPFFTYGGAQVAGGGAAAAPVPEPPTFTG